MRPFYLVQIFLGLTFTGVLTLTSCKKDEPLQPHVPSIQLTVEDVSCTEAWLKVSLTDSAGPRTVAILRDGQRVSVSRLLSPDSVFVIEGLLPRHTYTFLAQRLEQDSSVVDASTPAQAATMDSTSHAFHFEIDTLGVTASSLSDVAIINDTLAYAVGEMYLNDSTGQLDPIPYNVAKWDGGRWTPMRIQFYTICGQASRTPYPASALFAFSATDIWIAMRGDQVARWNGSEQIAAICLPVSFAINKLWGESANSLYAVGAGGNIVHYDGGTWQRVESGTTLPINDIWGAILPTIGQPLIIAVASDKFFNQGKKLLRITNGAAESLSDSALPWSLSGLWFYQDKTFYVCGDGLYTKHNMQSQWLAVRNQPLIYKNSVRGNTINDVFVVGAFGLVSHSNGLTWRHYAGNELPTFAGEFDAVATRGNKMFAVGFLNAGRAIVLRGTRQ